MCEYVTTAALEKKRNPKMENRESPSTESEALWNWQMQMSGGNNSWAEGFN